MTENSIKLHPAAAGFPWHSTIPVLRQNKHWKSVISMTTKLLNLFAEDDFAHAILHRGSRLHAKIAKQEIHGVNHNWSRFSLYMWPAADKRRLELMSATMAFIFIIDDVWEMQDEETNRIIQSECISLLRPPDSEMGSSERKKKVTPLQTMITQVIQGLHEEDSKGGNGGKDIIKWLIEYFNHPPPDKEYSTLSEFLNYRIDDAAAQYVFACAKFSLNSSVQIDSPGIKRFNRLALEQICYANDLGSYEKEKEAYDRGHALYFINTVDVVKRLFKLPDDATAKSATLALQKQTEMEMGRELNLAIV
uniref:Isoprenoid synthase domain-containing protein n=1 Tax=Psilocybe cubensis TaxID=181762 RepID=A0A8H7Y1N1_PSICU